VDEVLQAEEWDVTVSVVSAADGRFIPCFELKYATEAQALYAGLAWAEDIYPPAAGGHD
jgi:hypothetical protein